MYLRIVRFLIWAIGSSEQDVNLSVCVFGAVGLHTELGEAAAMSNIDRSHCIIGTSDLVS